MNLLFPIIAGSEYRQFLLSGIVSSLIENGNSVYLILKCNDEDLRKEILSLNSKVVILPYVEKDIKPCKYTYLQKVLDIDFENRFQRFRYGAEHKRTMKEKILSPLFRLIISNKLRFFIENRILQECCNISVPELEKELDENRIDAVVVNSARREYYLSLFIAAFKKRVPVKVVYHSNKEAIAQGRISYPFKRMGVWNPDMEADIIQRNPFLNMPIDIIGNTHFSYLNSDSYLIPRKAFDDLYGITKDTQVIALYTAAGVIIENQWLIIELLAEVLGRSVGNHYKIIIRQNPMDITEQWNSYFDGRSDVIVQKPKWVMNNQNSLNYAKAEDLSEYKSLLYYADFCINIPSTVTLEAAIMNLPVVNIAYDLLGVKNISNSKTLVEFWNAPFYQQYHNRDFVFPIYSNNDFEKNVIKVLNKNKKSYKDFNKCVSEVLADSIEGSFTKTLNFILGI